MAMSNDKLTEILDLYEAKATEILDPPPCGPYDDLTWGAARKVASMVPTCRQFLAEDRREKLMRWLGFMQGMWYLADVYTVDELKLHNMPPGEEFKGVAK